MSKNKDLFDKRIIIDFGDINNKEDKKKADALKEKLKEKLSPLVPFEGLYTLNTEKESK